MRRQWEICDRCGGEGKHDNDAFSNGISQSQFDEDPDFEEAYWKGHYDVTCTECDGTGKIDMTPDPEKEGNCDICGHRLHSYKWQEYPGAGYQTETECRNPKCPGE